jgi:hypothetical protein
MGDDPTTAGQVHPYATPRGGQSTAFVAMAIGGLLALTADPIGYGLGLFISFLAILATVVMHLEETKNAIKKKHLDPHLTVPSVGIFLVMLVFGYSTYRFIDKPTDYSKRLYDEWTSQQSASRKSRPPT